MNRSWPIAAAASIVLAAPAAPAAAAQSASIEWAPYDLELRSGDHWPSEIGTLEVPRLRSTPAEGTMRIRFVRLKAIGTPDGPPIIYLAGGPGSSGVEAAQGDRSALFARLRKHGDVILLDQRGTGLSDPPPKCSKPWQFPAEAVATEANVNRSLEAALRTCAAEWRSKGVTLEAYNSADNAADVADLIRALGPGKARILGISYGTFLGFALLRDHGELVDRAVFAGTEGPDHTLKLPTQADPVLKGLSERFAARDGGWSLEAAARRVFDRLAKAPATVTGKDGENQTVSLYDAQFVTTFLMATSANAERLPELFKAMDSGDFSGMAANVARLRGFYGALPAMPFAMDAASPTSPEREALVRSLVPNSLFGNAINFPSADLAGALGVPQLPARFHTPLESNVPALFISGELDSRTPPANAEDVRRGFASSAHLIVEGGGHDNDLFLATPAILDRIDAFLSGAMPKDETLPVDWAKPADR